MQPDQAAEMEIVMKKKNVAVILCDQLRLDHLSCYGAKDTYTPNIDRLAKEGVMFTSAVTASPVCAPARASMMTGRYVSDHQVWTNDVPFREGIECLPDRVNALGYRTGCFGKLHHYPARDTKGFQTAYQMEENRLGEQEDYLVWLKEKIKAMDGTAQAVEFANLDVFPEKDGCFPFGRELYYENWIADRAMEFMEDNDTPFFAWISFQGPHTPLDPYPQAYEDREQPTANLHLHYDPPCEVARYRKYRLDGQFTEEDHRDYRKKYGCLVEEIDFQVGRLIRHLEERGLYDDTLILFSADHGDLCGDYGMRQKGPFLYGAQLDIPLIVAHHPELPQGKVCETLTGNMDIGATILAYMGDERPFGYSRDIAVQYREPGMRREVIYSEFCDSAKIAVDRDYRFVYYPFSGECELVRNTEEMCPLQEQQEYSPVTQRMLQHIIDFMVIAKGVRIEAQDLTPGVQEGLSEKLPGYQSRVPLAFPIQNRKQIENLRAAGLNWSYNEFCRNRRLERSYGAYWEQT